MRRLLPIVGLVTVLAIPSVALAIINLTTAGGFLMDILETSGGYLSNGTSDAYDGAYYLEVGGTTYGGGTATTSLGGRNVILPEQSIAGLEVSRQIYVPSTGGEYARFLDVLRNTGSSPVTTTVTIRGNLGSDSSTLVHSSSSGDTIFSSADFWFGTDDTSDGSGDPSLAHVLQGDSATVSATSASITRDNFTWSFSVSVPAGGRVAFLTFAIQAMNRAAAQAEARRVVETPDDVLVGIDDYLDEIQNFSLATPGAPRVRFDAPFEMDEGSAVTVNAMVEDLEMDPFTFSWDTDDDGVFGELEGMDSYTIPEGSTDGPGTVRVGIQASDGTNTTERYRSISVVNVDPTITSSPPLVASVGAPYVYDIEVDEPAGMADPLSYALVAGPERMVISDEGRLTFTANEREVTVGTDTITVEVAVTDDDMGEGTQTWELTVSPNRAPTDPVPLYPVDVLLPEGASPRLVAGNAQDPDVEDALTYFFELDRSAEFDSGMGAMSGEVTETPGYTTFTPPGPLASGEWFWRVWVSDGTLETEPRVARFVVDGDVVVVPDGGVGDGAVGDGAVGDAGDGGLPPRERDRGGCAVGGSDHTFPSALLLAIFVWGFRRRVRSAR
jgi:hypothetical protein